MCIIALYVYEHDENELRTGIHFGSTILKTNFWGKSQDKGRQFQFLPRAPETHATPLIHMRGLKSELLAALFYVPATKFIPWSPSSPTSSSLIFQVVFYTWPI